MTEEFTSVSSSQPSPVTPLLQDMQIVFWIITVQYCSMSNIPLPFFHMSLLSLILKVPVTSRTHYSRPLYFVEESWSTAKQKKKIQVFNLGRWERKNGIFKNEIADLHLSLTAPSSVPKISLIHYHQSCCCV